MKKKVLKKLKKVSHLAMAEEYNRKPHELDEIIEQEHSIMQKLRASGLSDEELLETVGITVANNSSVSPDNNANVEVCIDSEDDSTADDSIRADDKISRIVTIIEMADSHRFGDYYRHQEI